MVPTAFFVFVSKFVIEPVASQRTNVLVIFIFVSIKRPKFISLKNFMISSSSWGLTFGSLVIICLTKLITFSV